MYLDAHLEKKFPDFSINITLQATAGECVALLGPSGSGKSTVLQLISGLIPLDGGHLRLAGSDCSRLAPEKRDIGFVFQDKRLFPNLSVFENVAFGLRVRDKDIAPAKDLLEKLHLSHLSHRSVGELSGGEAQRVALARALAFSPRLLLLDEPLKELDAGVKEKIKLELKALFKRLQVTAVYVTHDVEEAAFFSDSVILIRNGRSVQSGKVADFFSHPREPFVKDFFAPYRMVRLGGKRRIIRRY